MDNNSLPWFVSDPKAALEAYKHPTHIVVVDFETTNLDHGTPLNENNHIVLACWWIITPEGITKKSRFADEYDLAELEHDIRAAQFVVGCNMKFECGWFLRMGLDLHDILVYDTFLAEWVILANRSTPQQLGLNATAVRYGLGQKEGLSSQLIKGGVCPSEIPRNWLETYCHRDVGLAYEVYRKQMKILVEDELLHLALVRNLTCSALADIEFNGCQLDPQKVREEYDRAVNEYNEARRQLKEITGDTNLRSRKQLAVLLYEELGFEPPIDPKSKKPLMTAGGTLSTTVDTLGKLKAKTPDQEKFLDLYKKINKLNSLITKNLEFFKGVVEEYDGEFYNIYNQGFTQTGRLSSSGRQLFFRREGKRRGIQGQNTPREYKRLFYAKDDDWLCGEADGAQLEFRVGADFSRDPVAREALENWEDVHSDTAKVLIDAKEPGFVGLTVKQARQAAKSQSFAPMYGSNGKTPATKAYAQFFRQKYAGLYNMQRGWTNEVLNTGKLRTPYGMIFYWPGTKMHNSGYIENTTSIFNYGIQGGSTGEIIPIALVYFWHRARHHKIVVWSTIHDSIGSRLHCSEKEVYEELSKQALTTDVYWFLKEVYGYTFEVPLGVGVKISKHWGVAEEETIYQVWPSGREEKRVK